MAEILLSTFCGDKLKYDFYSEEPKNNQKILQREYEDVLKKIKNSDVSYDPYYKSTNDEICKLFFFEYIILNLSFVIIVLLKVSNTSELPLVSLSPKEKEQFPHIFNDVSLTAQYLHVRNKILAEWYKYSCAYMSLSNAIHYFFPPNCDKHVIDMTKNEEYIKLIKDTYYFLFYNSYINYGVLSVIEREIFIPSDRKKVTIIGGGLSGLACGKQLKRLGFNVRILEAKEQIGGRIHTIENDNVKIDTGAYLLSNEWKDHLSILLDQCSIESQVVPDKVLLLDHKKDMFKEVAFNVACRIFMQDLDVLMYSGNEEITNLTLFEAFELMKERKDTMADVLRNSILAEFDDLFNDLAAACIDGYCNLHQVLTDYERRKKTFMEYVKEQGISKKILHSQRIREIDARNTVISDLLAHVSLKKYNIFCDEIKDTRELIELMNEILDSATYYQNGEPHFLYDQFQELFFNSIEHTFGCNSKELKLSSMKQFSWSDKRQKFFSINNGLYEIIEKLSENLDIQVNKPIQKINYSKDDNSFHLEGINFEETCDIVVSTIPIGVLKANTIKFEPQLPISKINAINQCKLAVKREVIFQFNDIFWDKKVSVFAKVPNPFNSLEEMVIIYAVPSKPILIVLWGGDNASATFKWSKEKLIERSTYMLKSIFEKIYIPHTTVINKNWNFEPYIQCYHVIPIGDENIVKELGRPIVFNNEDHKNGIYFAGEHTNISEQGTLTAAFCSGLRVAAEIANDYIHTF
uniref:SWIRM domain-containing protein n=1 Tax=Parastrongyloides trichosuri TaxID=131310 RepID=A0A0N4ZPN6_PARTI